MPKGVPCQLSRMSANAYTISLSVGSVSDFVVLRLARRNSGWKEPEMRLWLTIMPFFFGIIGYFLYGWSATSGLHWMAIAVVSKGRFDMVEEESIILPQESVD